MDTNSKESMQQTIKQLQQKSQHIEKLLEKGNDVIIIQYGSHSIKYGMGNQQYPQKIRTILAYKVLNDQPVNPLIDQTQIQEVNDNAFQVVESYLRKRGNIKSETKQYKGKPKAKIEQNLKSLHCFEKTIKEVYGKSVLFEDDVYLVENRKDYVVKTPIKYGYLNLSNPQDTVQSVVEDLERLTYYILKDKLKINLNEIDKYSVILVIPDYFHRQHMKVIINMLLEKIGFNAIFLHLESVLATFGANVSQACVVNIGHDQINVCCVEEGIIAQNTMIKKNFGGADIDQFLQKLINRKHCINFKKKGFRLDPLLLGDMQCMQKLKEKVCSFKQIEDHSNRVYELHCVREGQEEIFTINHNEFLYLAPASLFHSEIFNSFGKFKKDRQSLQIFDYYSKYFDVQYDPEDYLEEYLVPINFTKPQMPNILQGGVEQSQLKNQQKVNDSSDENCNQQQQNQSMQIEQPQLHEHQHKTVHQTQQLTQQQQKSQYEEIINPFIMTNIDTLIAYSISQCKDTECRKKMANNILIIGGVSQMSQFIEELEDRVIESINTYCPNIERVEVIDPITRDILPIYISWVGATVIPRLESMKDMWITKNRWVGGLLEDSDNEQEELEQNKLEFKKERSNEFGIRYLKEKLPFQW